MSRKIKTTGEWINGPAPREPETQSVVYRVDVVAEVDMETGEVLRVNVDDEGITLHPDEDRESEAVKHADEAVWPAWQFGF